MNTPHADLPQPSKRQPDDDDVTLVYSDGRIVYVEAPADTTVRPVSEVEIKKRLAKDPSLALWMQHAKELAAKNNNDKKE